ncbi:hypothetical protein Tco_0472282 [Tanacetum coccineum]
MMREGGVTDRLLAKMTLIKGKRELKMREKANLFMELIEKKKAFCCIRAQEKEKNRPPPRHKENSAVTYLKHMGGFTTTTKRKRKAKKRGKKVERKQLKVAERRCLEGNAGKEQQKNTSKESKSRGRNESEECEDNDVELKKLLVIKKDEDRAIDAIPLATKLPVIIDYKLHKEGMLVHYQLIRVDGSSKRYSSMTRML